MSARSSRIGRVARLFPLAVAGASLTACGGGGPELAGVEFELPPTAVVYQVEIEGLPSEEAAALAEESLAVYRYREKGASSLALLRRRAENDLEIIGQILRSFGYYNGSAEVAVDEVEEGAFEPEASGIGFPTLSDLMFWKTQPGEDLEEIAKTYAKVLIEVDPGTQFTLAEHDFAFIDPESGAIVPSPDELGSPVGGPALAVPIVAAEAAAVELLKMEGYPYAERIDRDAVADLALAALAVETQLFSGPAAVFGPVEFVGLEDVEEGYLRTYIPWQPGEPITPEKIRVFNRELLATNLFDTAVVALPPDPPEVDGPVALPVVVTTDERPFRTISAGAQYSTDDGPGVTAGFVHRNLWGENETFTADAQLGLDLQGLNLGYREPQFGRPGQDLITALELVHEEDEAFDELRATLTGGFETQLSEQWLIGWGGLLEASRIEDDGVTREAYLAGLPAFAAYDGTDDLLNPTDGFRARLDAVPIAGSFRSEFTSFLPVDASASAYWDILDDDDYILAGRARLGSILSEDLAEVPKNHRFYAGGGGSVRGFARREVGPLDEEGDPIGGRSVAEASVEMRARLYGDIGGVVFVDAGTVDVDMFPDFDDVLYAAGVGVRYYSPVGPIRMDVAFPINPRDRDDAFQLYFSIGQAF